MNIDKKYVFNLHTTPGYTALSAYYAAVGYDPYLHDYKPKYIPDNLAVFSRPAVTNSTTPPPLYPSLPPEV